ncbi:pectate lyase [Microbulbifer celer]|uniref:Pectate lyase n=1 Tax=Microbulbifer celer TaxID=435905 RepID=A0ABW3U9A2_9GAMM|nr:pectate lyase [Microbulbifer celer]UFN57339.1 pectate lyase [Microbulbifer celer]
MGKNIKHVFLGMGMVLLFSTASGLHAQEDDNLSIGAGADGSSKQTGSSYGNVIDGDTGSYWSPDGTTGRISVKWPSTTTVGSVVIVEADGFEGNISTWELVNHHNGDVLAQGSGAGTISFDPVSLSKINFEILSSNGTPAVAEFETYATSRASDNNGNVNLAVSVAGDDVTLNWDVNNIDIASQSVYRDTDPNPQGRTRIAAGVSGNSYTDYDLADGTYYYWIKISDTSGSVFNSNGDDAEVATTSTTLTVQEGEGFCSVEGTIDSNHEGFGGSGFANTDNKYGASVAYSINADHAHSALLDIRYAATSDRPADIEVNGTVVGTVYLPATGAWSSWNSENMTVPLQAGENQIRLIAQTESGLPNIDAITVSGNSLTSGSCGAAVVMDCNDVTGQPAITVAQDGSGQYSSVQAAINSVSTSNTQPTQIRIKPGTYYEKLLIDRPNLTLCGETGKTASTILTYDDTAATPDGNGGTLGTSGSTSISVRADDVSFENLTMENSHGPGIQAVAVRIAADRVQFRNTRFLGNQDTLYVHSGSQYFKDCYVEGTVDYIFGRATAVFDNCRIHSVGNGTSITAPSTEVDNPYGIVFLGGEATASSAVTDDSVALGRNWRPYGAATYLNVDLGPHILPQGWRPMGDNSLDTARFAEYQNTGPGADTSQRVSQSRQLSYAEAENYTVANMFESWVPSYSGSVASAPTLSQEGNPVHDRFNRYLSEWSLSSSQADIILSHQYDNGGWPKNQEYGSSGNGGSGSATIDNGATTLEMTYMAEMYKRTGNTAYRDSARAAMDFLLAMQYPSGGWPQFYPLKGGYADHVTFNDDAMTRVLTVLYHAEKGAAPFDSDVFNSGDRAQFRAALDKGVEYILNAQWKQNGERTVWCAQHGATDYLPKPARAYELESLSGSESAEIIAFLMTQPQTPEIETAVKAALAWYRSPQAILEDYKYDKSTEEKIIYSPGDRMWYRFYDLHSNDGFFSDRDGGKYYDIMDISEERREGYSWGGGYGEKIIAYAENIGY